MGKKRGGRRGKAAAPENQPSQPEEVETPPSRASTSEITTAPITTSQGQRQELHAPTSAGDHPTQPLVQPTSYQDQSKTAWGRGPSTQPPIGKEPEPHQKPSPYPDQPTAWGRGTGRGRGQHTQGKPDRGRGRSGPQAAPGGPSTQNWGGARPKEHQQTQGRPGQGRGRGRSGPQDSPGGASTPIWGGTTPKEVLQRQPREELPKAAEKEIHESKVTKTPSLAEIGDLVLFKPGISGTPIRVETNHFRLNLGDLKTAYRYAVDIQPEKSPKKWLRQAMQHFLKVHVPNNSPTYDGQNILYSATRLPLGDDTISGSVTIGDNTEFNITIRLTGTIDLSPLHNLLQKKNIGVDDAFQCVETVFKQAYTSSFLSIGKRFYTPSSGNNYPLGSGAVMYLGGYQAAVSGWMPFLNVDVAHKAFTSSITIIDLILQMFSTKNRPFHIQDPQNNGLQVWQKEQLTGYLKNLKVVYEIPNLPGSKKVYKVNGLANIPSQEKFQFEDQVLTVEEFFKTKRHSVLKFSKLPTLWVGNEKKRICVPMEYCKLKEGQSLAGSRLLGTQTSQMIRYSATSTSERKKKIQNIKQQADHNNNACIREFGFSVSDTFEPLDARVLDPPCLQYSDGNVEPRNGTWWAKKFKQGAQIRKWTIVGFGIQRDRVNSKVNEFAKMVLSYGQSSGMFLSKAEEPFDYIASDRRSLNTCLEKKKNHDLVVVIFSNNKDSYYFVKQEAEQRIGFLTQCVKIDTVLYKLNETTVRNILLKINCKMNGTNHVLFSLDLIDKEPCMVMGADVTHPSPQARTIPSVIAVTASHDLSATKYNIHVGLQDPRTEMIKSLESITREKIRIFRERTGQTPKRIYFFRDGVSDGEFDKVEELEIQAIKRACFSQNCQSRVTFIIVQKRHHTRFFPTSAACSIGNYENVPVGTCVDTVITDPTMQNFYLISHQSIKGVGRPTKYCLLHDENQLSNDDVEKLAYYLCHLFTRCNRAVSYPAPTYFAHLAADRAKGYLHKKNIDLDNLDQRLVQINNNFAAKNPMFFS